MAAGCAVLAEGPLRLQTWLVWGWQPPHPSSAPLAVSVPAGAWLPVTMPSTHGSHFRVKENQPRGRSLGTGLLHLICHEVADPGCQEYDCVCISTMPSSLALSAGNDVTWLESSDLGVRRPVSSLPFIGLFNKYTLSDSCVPGTLQATRNSVMWSFHSSGEER